MALLLTYFMSATSSRATVLCQLGYYLLIQVIDCGANANGQIEIIRMKGSAARPSCEES